MSGTALTAALCAGFETNASHIVRLSIVATRLDLMPRRPRDFRYGGLYHVVSRGSNRGAIYRTDNDRSAFLDLVFRAVRKYKVDWVAYCLMPNHYHAIVRTPDERLSAAMRDLNGGYSRRCSAMYGRDAHLFRNRFYAERIMDLKDLVGTVCYVEMNPVRARLCAHPSEWHWSSYRAVVGLEQTPPFLSSEVFLRELAENLEAARFTYARYVESAVERHVSDTVPFVRPTAFGSLLASRA